MNTITLQRLDGTETDLHIPSNLHELTFGQYIELFNPDLTNFETLSVLTKVPVEIIYDSREIAELDKEVKIYIGLLIHSLESFDLYQTPGKIKFELRGKTVKINLKNQLYIEPAGAYLEARDIIRKAILKDVSDNEENLSLPEQTFNSSFESISTVIDTFMFCRINKKIRWQDKAKREPIAIYMMAADVLQIASHFYRSFPNLYKKGTSDLFKKSIIDRIRDVLSELKQRTKLQQLQYLKRHYKPR